MGRTRVAMWSGALVVLALGCSPPAPKAQYTAEQLLQVTDVKELMRFQYHSLDATWGLADQATLTPADFQTIGEAATRVQEVAGALLQNFAAGRPESFRGFAEQLKANAEALGASAAASDVAATKSAIGKLDATCDSCHAVYR